MRIVAASERNKDPILQVLAPRLAGARRVLEVASGTGQHLAYFAQALPEVTFYPTEVDQSLVEQLNLDLAQWPNIAKADRLDLLQAPQHQHFMQPFDAVIVANLFHISPALTMAAFMQLTQRVLKTQGFAHVYGPFKRNGEHTSGGNAVFDAQLMQRDPDWGIRDLETLLQRAAEVGLGRTEVIAQPANNLSVILRLSD